MSDTARPKSGGDKLSAAEINADLPVVLNAGETINGATLPVPVYVHTDGELYACDANDQAKLEFAGFAVSNSTDGNPITFQKDGVVSGFSGLTIGSRYYVQDAVGTIGTTKGTYEVLVGRAISATQILIEKGSWQHIGTDTLSANSAATTPVDTSTIPTGTRFIIIDINTYSVEGGTTQQINRGSVLMVVGLLNTAYIYGANGAGGATYKSSCSISGSTLTVTGSTAGGGGATAYLEGNVYYFR